MKLFLLLASLAIIAVAVMATPVTEEHSSDVSDVVPDEGAIAPIPLFVWSFEDKRSDDVSAVSSKKGM
ncbi:hypothetical protein EV121DRAFT_295147 [Schizophyllum commune]